MRKTTTLLSLIAALLAFALALHAQPSAHPKDQAGVSNKKVDLNSASEQELESLPGVGTVSSKRSIIAS